MKLSETGDSLWYRDYSHVPEISSDIFNFLMDIKQTSDGGFIACGNYQNYFAGINDGMYFYRVKSRNKVLGKGKVLVVR
jgi:hypothetical protein